MSNCISHHKSRWLKLFPLFSRILKTCIFVPMLDLYTIMRPNRKIHQSQLKIQCVSSLDLDRNCKICLKIINIIIIWDNFHFRMCIYLKNSSRFPCSATVQISTNPPVYAYPNPTTNASENASTVAYQKKKKNVEQ